jgi:hypothetical protein
MRYGKASIAALTLALLTISADARPLRPEQEARIKPVGAPVKCIFRPSIRNIRIRGDQVIDFYVSGRKVYRNRLLDSCPGLAHEERFRFPSLVGTQLCETDAVTVVRSMGVTQGPTCSLGKFQQISGAPRILVPTPEDDLIR